jgi:lysophospholipase L1-like esterase
MSLSSRVLGRVGMALASAFFALGLAEIALRRGRPPVADLVGVHRKSDDPELAYELAPGTRAQRDGVEIAINSAGFRDDEFPEPAPDGMRIVVVGDSIAWGWGVPMEGAFPQLLEQRLHALAGEAYASSVVYNLAVDGYATAQEVRLLETRGLALRPDLVVVSYCLNDPDQVDVGLTACFVPRIEVVDLVQRGLRGARDWFRDVPEEYHHKVHVRYRDELDRSFRRLGEISRDRSVPIVVAVTPGFRYDPPYPWRDLHDLIRGLCEANGLLCLDLQPVFEPLDLKEHGIDVWHPSARGHAVIADALLDFVRARPPAR